MALDIKLEDLRLEELKSLRKRIDGAIASYEDRRKKQALDAAAQAAKDHGFTLQELTNSGKGTKKARYPKYAHPDDAARTWSGLGRRPVWVTELLDSGKSLDDLKA